MEVRTRGAGSSAKGAAPLIAGGSIFLFGENGTAIARRISQLVAGRAHRVRGPAGASGLRDGTSPCQATDRG